MFVRSSQVGALVAVLAALTGSAPTPQLPAILLGPPQTVRTPSATASLTNGNQDTSWFWPLSTGFGSLMSEGTSGSPPRTGLRRLVNPLPKETVLPSLRTTESTVTARRPTTTAAPSGFLSMFSGMVTRQPSVPTTVAPPTWTTPVRTTTSIPEITARSSTATGRAIGPFSSNTPIGNINSESSEEHDKEKYSNKENAVKKPPREIIFASSQEPDKMTVPSVNTVTDSRVQGDLEKLDSGKEGLRDSEGQSDAKVGEKGDGNGRREVPHSGVKENVDNSMRNPEVEGVRDSNRPSDLEKPLEEGIEDSVANVSQDVKNKDGQLITTPLPEESIAENEPRENNMSIEKDETSDENTTSPLSDSLDEINLKDIRLGDKSIPDEDLLQSIYPGVVVKESLDKKTIPQNDDMETNPLTPGKIEEPVVQEGQPSGLTLPEGEGNSAKGNGTTNRGAPPSEDSPVGAGNVEKTLPAQGNVSETSERPPNPRMTGRGRMALSTSTGIFETVLNTKAPFGFQQNIMNSPIENVAVNENTRGQQHSPRNGLPKPRFFILDDDEDPEPEPEDTSDAPQPTVPEDHTSFHRGHSKPSENAHHKHKNHSKPSGYHHSTQESDEAQQTSSEEDRQRARNGSQSSYEPSDGSSLEENRHHGSPRSHRPKRRHHPGLAHRIAPIFMPYTGTPEEMLMYQQPEIM